MNRLAKPLCQIKPNLLGQYQNGSFHRPWPVDVMLNPVSRTTMRELHDKKERQL